MSQILFILLLAASGAFFARTVWIFGRAVAQGRAEPRPRLDDVPGRLMDVGIYFFGQKKVAEEGPMHRTSKHHLFIFWGFLIITIATADVIVSGVIPGVSLRLLPDVLYQPLYLLIDVMNFVVLLMIVWAVIRRTIVKPRLIPWNLDAGLILGGIGSLMITHFLLHGYHIAAEISAGGAAPWWQPTAGLGGRAPAPIDADRAARGATRAYWAHGLIRRTVLN